MSGRESAAGRLRRSNQRISHHLPPLRERVEDISALAHHFLRQTHRRLDRHFSGIEPAALARTKNFSWRPISVSCAFAGVSSSWPFAALAMPHRRGEVDVPGRRIAP